MGGRTVSKFVVSDNESIKKIRARRNRGVPFKLSPHWNQLNTALGLSPTIGQNNLLRDIARKNPIVDGDEHERVSCYLNDDLEVNKSQCVWCKSRSSCDNLEAGTGSGSIEITIEHETPEDLTILRRFLGNRLLSSLEKEGTSMNHRYFFFDDRSRFVFSEKNDLDRSMHCQPLFSSERKIQPIKHDYETGAHLFSPKISYCPPLRRNLTLFETQILNCLNIQRSESTRSVPECEDLVKSVLESEGLGWHNWRIKPEIINAIENEYTGGKTPYRALYKLIERGGLCAWRYSQLISSPDAVKIDFFDSWEEVRGESDEQEIAMSTSQLRVLTRKFIESLCSEIIPREMNRIPESMRSVNFVERRVEGVIIHDGSSSFQIPRDLGVRIVREVSCPGVSVPYLLVDGKHSDYFTVENSTTKEKSEPSFLENGETAITRKNDPIRQNREIAEILNRVFSRSNMLKVKTTEELLERDDFGERCYVLFDEFEFQSANNFHDILRHGLVSSRKKHSEILIEFIRSLAERTILRNNNTDRQKAGRLLRNRINQGGRFWDSQPVNIIQDLNDEGGLTSEFFGYEKIEVPGNKDRSYEAVSFYFWEEDEKEAISLKRKLGEKKFDFVREPKIRFYSRKTRSSLKKTLSSIHSEKYEVSQFTGGIYLGRQLRERILDDMGGIQSNELPKLISEICKTDANNETAFLELERGAFLGIKHESRKVGEVVTWKSPRSPTEGYNSLFDEDSI